MDFFIVSLNIGNLLSFIALFSNLILCYVKRGSKLEQVTYEIVKQCRWTVLIYLVLAWFIGDESIILETGRTTHGEVAHIMLINARYWILIFINTLICKIWNSGDKMTKEALVSSVVYFVVGYLIQ